jgi:hypothetical protein
LGSGSVFKYEVQDPTDLGFSGYYANLLSEFPKKPGFGKEASEKLEGLELGQKDVLHSIDVVNDYILWTW